MSGDLPVLVLFGPTASGKTALLQRLHTQPAFPDIELISADSRQVYRGFAIGTAAPGPDERARFPHHLIATRDPRQRWDVGSFVEAADRLVEEIRGRGRLPVISGGTAFYLQSWITGLPATPRASREVRQRLEERLRTEGVEVLWAELRQVDPLRARQIASGDTYRMLRALEIFEETGQPPSSFQIPQQPRPGLHARVVGLDRPRGELYERINARVAQMFVDGLPEEVRALLADGVPPDAPAFSSIGYREFLEIGGMPPWTPAQLEQIRDLIARNTRRYARRQELFFRRLPEVIWVSAGDPDAAAARIADVLDIP